MQKIFQYISFNYTPKRSLFGYGNYKLVTESAQGVRFLEWDQ